MLSFWQLGGRGLSVHILILGAAGMIGRKLTSRLVADGQVAGQAIERLTLADVVTPEQPAGAAGVRARGLFCLRDSPLHT